MFLEKQSIVVVGGGTAGWITATYLASVLDVNVTIVHSNEIDPVGVGESTTPTIKHVADAIGIDETIWMKDARASFKYGIEFMNFNHEGSRWFHPFDDLIPGEVFSAPVTEFGKAHFKKTISSVEMFLSQYQKGDPKYNIDWFNHSQGGAEFLLQRQLSPYNSMGHANYSKFPGYAYHINAFQFGESLRKHTPADRYTEIIDTVVHIEYNEDGIKELVLKSGQRISGDLYIDCTGFRRLLIGDLTKFKSYENLINNASVWGPVKTQIYRPSTMATATDYGWIWNTPTWGQIGSGYVFCDDLIDVDTATEQLRKHWADQGQVWEPVKSVKFQSGRLEQTAIKNVVSNGFAQSFIEPLEATAVMNICSTARNIARIFKKHNKWTAASSQSLSRITEQYLTHTKHFVEGHYTLSDRRDTEYWRAYDRTNVLEWVAERIEARFNTEWLEIGETNYNSFNWACMLVGYNKPYVGKLPKIDQEILDNYEFVSRQIKENYEQIYRNNQTVKDRLAFINQR